LVIIAQAMRAVLIRQGYGDNQARSAAVLA
jgi:hypothetical protein